MLGNINMTSYLTWQRILLLAQHCHRMEIRIPISQMALSKRERPPMPESTIRPLNAVLIYVFHGVCLSLADTRAVETAGPS